MQLSEKKIQTLIQSIPNELLAMVEHHGLPKPQKIHTFSIGNKKEEIALYDLETIGYSKSTNYCIKMVLEGLHLFLSQSIMEIKTHKQLLPIYRQLKKACDDNNIATATKIINEVTTAYPNNKIHQAFCETISESLSGLESDKLDKKERSLLKAQISEMITAMLNKKIDIFKKIDSIQTHIQQEKSFEDNKIKISAAYIRYLISKIYRISATYFLFNDTNTVSISDFIDGFFKEKSLMLDNTFIFSLYKSLLVFSVQTFLPSIKEKYSKEKLDLYNKKLPLKKTDKKKYVKNTIKIDDKEILIFLKNFCIFIDSYFQTYHQAIKNHQNIPQAIGDFIYNLSHYWEKNSSNKKTNRSDKDFLAIAQERKNFYKSECEKIYDYMPELLFKDEFFLDITKEHEETFMHLEKYASQFYIKTSEELGTTIRDIHQGIERFYFTMEEDDISLEKLIENLMHGTHYNTWDQEGKRNFLIKNKNHGDHVVFIMAFYNIIALVNSFLMKEFSAIDFSMIIKITKNFLNKKTDDSLFEAIKPILEISDSLLSKLVSSINALLIFSVDGQSKATLNLSFIEKMIMEINDLLGQSTNREDTAEEIRIADGFVNITLPHVTDSLSYDFITWLLGKDKQKNPCANREKELPIFKQRRIGLIPFLKWLIIDKDKKLISPAGIPDVVINNAISSIFKLLDIESKNFSLKKIDKILVNGVYDSFITHSHFQKELDDYDSAEPINDSIINKRKKEAVDQFLSLYDNRIKIHEEYLVRLEKDVISTNFPFNFDSADNVKFLNAISRSLKYLQFELNSTMSTEWIYKLQSDNFFIDGEKKGCIVENNEKILIQDFFKYFTFDIENKKAKEFKNTLNEKKKKVDELIKKLNFNKRFHQHYWSLDKGLLHSFNKKVQNFLVDIKNIDLKKIENTKKVKNSLVEIKKEHTNIHQNIEKINVNYADLVSPIKNQLYKSLDCIINEENLMALSSNIDRQLNDLLLGNKEEVQASITTNIKLIEDNEIEILTDIKEKKELEEALRAFKKSYLEYEDRYEYFFKEKNEITILLEKELSKHNDEISYLDEEGKRINYILGHRNGSQIETNDFSKKTQQINCYFSTSNFENLVRLLDNIDIKKDMPEFYEIKCFFKKKKSTTKKTKPEIAQFLEFISETITSKITQHEKINKKNLFSIEKIKKEKQRFNEDMITYSQSIKEKEELIQLAEARIATKKTTIELLDHEVEKLKNTLEKINKFESYNEKLMVFLSESDILLENLQRIDKTAMSSYGDFLDIIKKIKKCMDDISDNKKIIEGLDNYDTLIKDADERIQLIEKTIKLQKNEISTVSNELRNQLNESIHFLDASENKLFLHWNTIMPNQSFDNFKSIQASIDNVIIGIGEYGGKNNFIRQQINLLAKEKIAIQSIKRKNMTEGRADKKNIETDTDKTIKILEIFCEKSKRLNNLIETINDAEREFIARNDAVTNIRNTIACSLSEKTHFFARFFRQQNSTSTRFVYKESDPVYMDKPLTAFVENGNVAELKAFCSHGKIAYYQLSHDAKCELVKLVRHFKK